MYWLLLSSLALLWGMVWLGLALLHRRHGRRRGGSGKPPASMLTSPGTGTWTIRPTAEGCSFSPARGIRSAVVATHLPRRHGNSSTAPGSSTYVTDTRGANGQPPPSAAYGEG